MLKDSLNSYFISACFGDKYIGEKPEEVVKQYTENYISEYRRDLETDVCRGRERQGRRIFHRSLVFLL